MKKLIFYSLLIVSALASCKKDDPTPDAQVEGKWDLSSVQIAMKPVIGEETDETVDYNNLGVYLELKSNNKFSTNLALADAFNGFFTVGQPYESDYEVKGNEITLKIYDGDYEDYLPVKMKVQSATESGLVLQFTKTELAELMKEYDKLDGDNSNSQMLVLITSLNAVLSFSK